MQSPARCLACGEHGHCPSKCKAVAIPPDGFYTGGGGGGGHSHDDDDESAAFMRNASGSLGAQNDSAGGESLPTSPTLAAAARGSPNTPSSVAV
jgi:hypothetical protein